MNAAQILELGEAAFTRRPLAPSKRVNPISSAVLIGFDCEYLSRPRRTMHTENPQRTRVRANQVLCVSLAHGTQSAVLTRGQLGVRPRGVRVADFVREVRRVVKNEFCLPLNDVCLASFFSVAELSILDIYDTEETRFTLVPNGVGAYTLTWSDELGTLTILDIAVWFPHQNLAAVAKTFNLEKRDYDASSMTIRSPRDPLFWEYARHDAVLAYEIAARWRALALERLGVDILRDTTPAQAAVRVFRADYLQQETGRVSARVRRQALLSYCGGNNTAYYRGYYIGKLYAYDAVSMYPSAAIQLGYMPRATDWKMLLDVPGHSNLESMIDGVCHVRFEFPEGELYPCLPVTSAGAMYFPTRGESHCTLSEVLYARSIGCDVTLLSGWGYSSGCDALSRYCAGMLEAKQQAHDTQDSAARAMYKLLANALIGKFAQHIHDYDLNAVRCVAGANRMRLDEFWRIPEADRQKLATLSGSTLEPQTRLGSAWCPEWSVLVLGRARRIQAQAVRDTQALSGVTDSIITSEDKGESFTVNGITYAREAESDKAVIVRSRLYAMYNADGAIIKAALHGAPRTPQMAKRLIAWNRAEGAEMRVGRIARVKEGLMRGGGIGMKLEGTMRINYKWDNKRSLGISVGDGMNLIYGAITLPHLEVL